MSDTKRVRVRIPNVVYDRYCQRSVRQQRTVQDEICLTLMQREKRGGRKAPPVTIFSFRMPKGLYSHYRRLARQSGRPIGTVIREHLIRRARWNST